MGIQVQIVSLKARLGSGDCGGSKNMTSIVAPSLEESVEGIQSAAFEGLLQKIHQRQAKVGIIGLGYVGLPLAVEFARAGFSVTGFDTDRRRAGQGKQW
jgi:hypothetical protein